MYWALILCKYNIDHSVYTRWRGSGGGGVDQTPQPITAVFILLRTLVSETPSLRMRSFYSRHRGTPRGLAFSGTPSRDHSILCFKSSPRLYDEQCSVRRTLTLNHFAL